MRNSVIAAIYRGWRRSFADRNVRPRKLSPTAFVLNHFLSLEQRLITAYRVGNELLMVSSSMSRILRRVVKSGMHRMGSSIAFSATIGKGVQLPHPFGIVIGEGVVIGESVTIWQQVTLGSSGRHGAGREYPTVGNGAKLYAKCTVIGQVEIAEGAVVAAGAVVTSDVPARSIAAGVPARIVGTVVGEEV